MTNFKELKAWCDSDAQTRAIDAILASDGNVRKAARSLGLHHKTVQHTLARVQAKAARGGYAPGHFEHGVAPGYLMGKVTIHRDGTGTVKNTWERQNPDDQVREQLFRTLVEELSKELPREKPVPSPIYPLNSDLLNFFPVTDYHLGMLSWAKETGADWDMEIAEELLYNSFKYLINNAPPAETAVLCQLGDFFHFDGLKAITPGHGNLLDADTRFEKMIEVGVRALRRIVNMLLMTHKHVHVIMAEGNHDESASAQLRVMFSMFFEDEPRVTVDTSAYPYYVYPFGKTLIGAHHGHLSKNTSLPGLFAAKFREEWGKTTKTYIYTGHRHHEETKEFPGAKVFQLPTMAAADAYAARGGWLSERQMSRITFHREFGKRGEEIVTPEMFEVVAS